MARECPNCGGYVVETQDRRHGDWMRECRVCGWSQELLPRAASRRNQSSSQDYDFMADGEGSFAASMDIISADYGWEETPLE